MTSLKKARSSLLKRFLRTAMNQEPGGDSTTSPRDSCSRTLAGDKEHRSNVPATPSWTDVPSSASLVCKPIPRKPIIAAKFGNFPAGSMQMVSTGTHKGTACSTQDDSSLVLGSSSNTKEPPKTENKAILGAGKDCLIPKSLSSCYPRSANPSTTGPEKLAITCTPAKVEESASEIVSQLSTKLPSGAIRVFSSKPVNSVSSTPQMQSASEHASGVPVLDKCFGQTLEDLEVMETDTTTVAHQSVIFTNPAGGSMKGVSKLVASEEEGGASEEEVGASEEEGGASDVEGRASVEGGASGKDEEVSLERVGTLLPIDTGIEKTDPKGNKPNSEHCLLEEYDTNFLFTVDDEGLLIENQHKRKSTKRKKSQGISDKSSPVLAPGGGVVKSKKWGYKGQKKVATREEQRARSSRSDRKSDNKSDSTKKSKKPLPNAFVSVRIPSAEIKDKLKEIQEAIVARDNKLQSTLVSLDKLHLTLFVIRLESETEVERAKVALLEATQRVTAEMKLLSSPIVLEFGGVSSFSKRVVFASIKEGLSKARLTSAADMVRSIFETHGICSTDERSFNPHLTIAKVTKSSGRERIYGIEKEVYSEFIDTELGSEVVTGFELLSMVEPAAADGYYHCLQRYTFEEISTSSRCIRESLESRVASLPGSLLHSSPHGEEPQNEAPLHSSPHGEEPGNEAPLHSSLHREEPGNKANSWVYPGL